MATGTAGSTARRYHTSQVHYLLKKIQYSGGASAVVTVGKVPAGAVVINAGVVVATAFNAGTSNVLDIGTATDDDGFATDLALGTIGRIAADELATSNDLGPFVADTAITATLALSGTAATAGEGWVYVEFLPNLG